MCGIVGYYGKKDAIPILINGLKRLEYRGYDSAGIAVIGANSIDFIKKAGKVKYLEAALMDSTLRGSIGIAHTRWATHGEPNDVNAHPHLDHTESIAPVTISSTATEVDTLVEETANGAVYYFVSKKKFQI